MELDDLIHKTCLIGLSYFDCNGKQLKQSQLSGQVIAVDPEEGISIELLAKADSEAPDVQTVFKLPATLSAWFVAPPGHYRNSECGVDIENPDFLVTWDIHKTRDDTEEGQHEWWEWVPRTSPPQVSK